MGIDPKEVSASLPVSSADIIGELQKTVTRLADSVAQAQRAPAQPTADPLSSLIAARMQSAQRPLSDAGPPASPTMWNTAETPLHQLPQHQREALVAEKGLGWYRATLRRQLKGVRVRIR